MSSFAEQHQKEFDQLRKHGRLIKTVALIGLIALLLYPAIHSPSPEIDSIEAARGKLIASNFPLSAELIEDYSRYNAWLEQYAGEVELRSFEHLARNILTAAAVHFDQDNSENFLTRMMLSYYFSLLRVTFVVVVSARIWCFAIIIGALWSLRTLKLYRGNDMLGELGNGRLFFSGVRLSLDQVDAAGVPLLQTTGLACPAKSSVSTAKASKLSKILDQFKASNDTNLELSAIILAAQYMPCYVAGREEPQTLESYIEPVNLLAGSETVLESMLSIHKALMDDADITYPNSTHSIASESTRYTAKKYAEELANACARSLTFDQRQAIIQIPPAHIATLVLSIIAGRVLTYSQEADRWIHKSQYPHLCARAVLHSVSAFGKQYQPEERTNIRQALVYAARRSAFASVRLPIVFSQARLALRQWAELLICSPHELLVRADEVELFGLVQELHAAWANKFVESLAVGESKLSQHIYVADNSNLFFAPLHDVIDSLKANINQSAIQRLDELMSRVSQIQKVRLLAFESKDDGQTSSEQLSLDRVMDPLSMQEIKELSSAHGISIDDLKSWSALRLVLNAFGWLARRVGDYSVPSSSVIYGVFKAGQGFANANEYGFIGFPGMVALRATRLVERFGRSWQSRFIRIESASMAESFTDYQKRMRGVVDKPQDDLASGGA